MNKEYYKNYSANRRKLAKEQMSNSRPNPAGEIGQIGNAAKLREALKQVSELNDLWFDTFTLPDGATSIHDEIEDVISAALAAPPRNCDVGTPEEQAERFRVYCESHKDPESECLECPLFGITGGHCELAWAQLPYEREAAK